VVNVGVTHDTAEFAVESIRPWWRLDGKRHYRDAGRLLICADGYRGQNDDCNHQEEGFVHFSPQERRAIVAVIWLASTYSPTKVTLSGCGERPVGLLLVPTMDLTKEIQVLSAPVVSDPNTIVRMHLAGSDQIRQRLYQQTLESIVSVTGSVPRIGAFR
jgi:hypothetical protein